MTAPVLAGAEDRFRALVENNADAICLFDARGIIVYANASCQRILDYPPETLVGRDGWELIHPDDRPAMARTMAELLARPGGSLEVTLFRLLHRNGSWRWMETVATNLLELPSVRAVVATYRDVTARVELEEQLRQSQKMEALGLLAGGVAHDFNNLLTVIIASAERVAMSLSAGHPALEDLANVRQAASSAAGITRKLLVFSRRQPRSRAVFNLRDMLRDFEPVLARVVGTGIVLEVATSSEPLPIEGDQAQLQQLLLNLCTNAREAMPEGGRLRVAARRLSPARLALEVTDTGVGMDAETRRRILEPFFTTRTAGSGLGMSVVLRAVQDHQGTITIDTAPARGTTVRVELPLHG